MKGQLRWISIVLAMAILGLSACGPVQTSVPPVPTLTPVPTPMPSPSPSPTPSPVPDPRAKYEGECVFCFLNSETDPHAPIWDDSAQGWTYRNEDHRQQVTIDETLSVPAGKTVTFNNQIVLVKPTSRKYINIYGTLSIKNSLLIWLNTEDGQTGFDVQRGGTLSAQDSYSFRGSEYALSWPWHYEDGSTIHFDHFICDAWASLDGSVNYTAANYSTAYITILRFTHDSTIQVSNSHSLWLELYFPEGHSYTLELPEKLHWDEWDLSGVWPNTTIQISDSYIREEDIGISNDTQVTIENSPAGFSLGWTITSNNPDFITCELRGLGKPGDETGVLYDNSSWYLPCNNSKLTLLNSRLERAWPTAGGYVHLKLFDSYLFDPGIFDGPATMEIYDSTLAIVRASQGGRIYVENSPIEQAIEVRDPDSRVYGFGVTGPYELLESGGGAYVPLEQPGPPWE